MTLSVETWLESQCNLSLIISFLVFSTKSLNAINHIYYAQQWTCVPFLIADSRRRLIVLQKSPCCFSNQTCLHGQDIHRLTGADWRTAVISDRVCPFRYGSFTEFQHSIPGSACRGEICKKWSRSVEHPPSMSVTHKEHPVRSTLFRTRGWRVRVDGVNETYFPPAVMTF